MSRPIRSAQVYTLLVLGAAIVGTTLTVPTPAKADSPFAQLVGNWTGAGNVHFSGGTSEAVRCKAYYTSKDAGSGLGLALRCASASSQIELRALLSVQAGRIVGTWEERHFNAAGAVDGTATAQTFSLAINGGGFKGAMAVGVKGQSQTVTISTEGIGMTGVSINLSRG